MKSIVIKSCLEVFFLPLRSQNPESRIQNKRKKNTELFWLLTPGSWILCFIVYICVWVFAIPAAHAAVGCDLNDPDRDVARLFPGSTGYKTMYVSIDKKGGDALLAQIEERLGDKFQGLFETGDVPYTIYEIYKGTDKIGYIHGVNQKGQYGGIQVFLVMDMEGIIKSLYFQKLTSKAAKELRAPEFGKQFEGFSLADFYTYDVASGKTRTPGKVDQIKNPTPEAEQDFKASMRAAKKNLILMDEFIYGNKFLKYFKLESELP